MRDQAKKFIARIRKQKSSHDGLSLIKKQSAELRKEQLKEQQDKERQKEREENRNAYHSRVESKAKQHSVSKVVKRIRMKSKAEATENVNTS